MYDSNHGGTSTPVIIIISSPERIACTVHNITPCDIQNYHNDNCVSRRMLKLWVQCVS